MPEISKALIIDEPWITHLLQGHKIWELRSRQTQYRGWFGLIKKGSGQVVAVARLTSVSDYLDDAMLERTFGHHQVGPELYSNPDYKWRYAWKLEDIRPLVQPVPYQHKSGAVTWVTLNPEAQVLLKLTCGDLEATWQDCGTAQDEAPGQGTEEGPEHLQADIGFASAAPESKPDNAQASAPVVTAQGNLLVPVARDGSRFTPETRNTKGKYWVGEKGDEVKFTEFSEALEYLRQMPTAKWRRPNASGNWGIVSAVAWVEN
ncbi:ASCH domain-containing protein [Microbulbifer agarilyticus]